MDPPLHHQSSFDQHQYQQYHQQQEQHQNFQHYQQAQQMATMQGSPQIGSPLMNRVNYNIMQQQHQNHYVAQHPSSPSRRGQVHHYSSQQPQQQQQHHKVLHNPTMQHGLQPHGHYNPHQQQQQHYVAQQYQQQLSHAQQQPMQHHPSNYNRNTAAASAAAPIAIGPRAKCDQVIYEAMAKACEIAVRGRCTDFVDDTGNGESGGGGGNDRGYSDSVIGGTNYNQYTPRTTEKRRSWNYGGSRSPGGRSSGNAGSSTSSRFNIEVDEVPAVRTTVQSWKRAPHTPLRLDIYYEHDGCYDDRTAEILGSGADDRPPPPPPPPQRELLERWCVDYVPSPSSAGNSMSSPYSSPSSSPYSSRVMTGSFVSGSGGGDKSSSMSQLRQVCKRIVVLLRSLHCLTRMLPSYRLKCLLLSNIANGGVTVNNGLVGGMALPPAMVTTGLFGNGIGWGSIGYSIHVGDGNERGEPSLPSPSFARQSFPSVPTPYGNLCLSVMYDATLNPNHMMADLVERRTEWLQRRWMAAEGGGGQQLHYQQYQPPVYAEQNPMGVVSTFTQPIPIIDQAGGQHQHMNGMGGSTAAPASNSRSDKPRSCPPAVAYAGGLPFGSVGRTRAVSDFIIKDYHNSPKLKPLSRSPQENVAGGEKERVMSGLSLAMMNDEANGNVDGSPAGQGVDPKNSPKQQQRQQQPRQEVDMGLPSFGSPTTRAAFHNPPPLYNLDDDIHQVASSGSPYGDEYHNHHGAGTHFFQKHGGYGYGYNGSNVQFGGLEPPPPPPSMGTPPTPQRGVFPSARSRSPSVTRNDSGGNDGYGFGASPFVNGTTFQPPPSPGTTHRNDTPPTTSLFNASRHHDSNRSPLGSSKGGSALGSKGSDNVQQQRSRQRTSSSHQSMQLLPPLTSLDILAKSPFLGMATATRKTMTNASTMGGDEGEGNNQHRGGGPFILGSYGDDTLPSSIPQMVSNERNGSIAVSTLGGGGGSSNSNNPLMPLGELSSAAGGSNSAASPDADGNSDAKNNQPAAETTHQPEEMPFAVDDDVNPHVSGAIASSPSPSKSGGRSSLWGSTKADALDGTIGGGGAGGIAEITSTLAVSSLHHRCAADGKVRLKMFESTRTVESNGDVGGGGGLDPTASSAANGGGDPTSDFDSIKDQLSEFRSFGASLMVGSASHDSQAD